MKSIFFAALLSLSTLAYGQRGPMHRHHPGFGHRDRIVERLKLTDDQRKQFDKISSALARKQIALRAKIISMRVDMRDLVREDPPSKTKIETLEKDMNRLEGDIKANRTDFWFDVNTILTPEQKQEWKAALASPARRPMRGLMHWEGGGDGAGR